MIKKKKLRLATHAKAKAKMASPTAQSVATCAFSADAENSMAKKPKILNNDDVTGFYELSNDGLKKICSKINSEKSDLPSDMETDVSVEKKTVTITGDLDAAEDGKLAPKANNDKQESAILVKYPPNFKGEIFLLVDSSECRAMKNDRITTGLTLLSQIKDLKMQDLDFIYAIGRSLYKVTFKNVYAANSFLVDNRIKKRGLKPFLPRTALEIYGVVRGVPECFNEYDILKNARSAATIVSVMRFKRKDPLNDNTYIPTTTIKIGFSGNDVPKEIIFEHTKLNVDIYIPPLRQCVNCGRLGHTKLGCKSDKRCLQCGKTECSNKECDTNACILCGRNGHSSKDKDKCPHWEKEMSVNRIKTVKKMTRKEVLDTYFPKNSNRFDILANEEENFPSIVKENSFVDMTENINRNFTKRKYSNVVKRGSAKDLLIKNDNQDFQPRPKPIPNPVYNSLSYQKNIVTQFERLIAEMIRITQNLTIQNKDSNCFQQLQQLKNQFESILVKRDELEINESLLSTKNPNEGSSI